MTWLGERARRETVACRALFLSRGKSVAGVINALQRRWQTEVWLIGSLRDKELQERRAPACSYPPSGEPLSLGMGQSFSFPPSIPPSVSVPFLSSSSISVHEVENDETLLTRICVYASVNIFPIVSHSNTYPLKHLHVYNSLTSSYSSTTKAEKHLPPQISLSDCGSAGNQIFTFLQVFLNLTSHAANRPKRLETRFMKPSSWERQPTSKIVSPRETDENKNDIKGSSQFLAQIKGDEFLAALNARLSPGIEIDIN
ncbi:hypothetical protein DPX16_17473 [Anabarilius grahami]|uniref:Uncharacterized protein n=1 Tax=Anabarilius grahami TaxID=495550 RepID=A0A3N0Y0S5_ANAGA|nr:hypothetical protein DPX16_17473 [Anabarilius grahami]